MSLNQGYIKKLVERFGVGAELIATVTPNYIRYHQVDVVPGQQLEIRLRVWQARHTPGLYEVIIKSETELEEFEIEVASRIFREEYLRCTSAVKK
jgi:hypothetical protein